VNDVPLRLAFAGTPDLAATVLQALLDIRQYRISLVLTQPDRPAGRGRKILKSAVKILAEKNHIRIRQPAHPSEIDPDCDLANVDVLVVAAFGMILPSEILNRPRLGCINVHTSLLPRWRGAAPIQRAILTGDSETGITIIKMDAGLDTGDMLLRKSCLIHRDDTVATLEKRLAILGGECVLEVLDRFTGGKTEAIKQDDSLASYAGKISKQEARIDWTRPAIDLERMIRAFNPQPVAYTELKRIEMRIWEASVIENQGSTPPPGSICSASAEGIDVATGDQLLRIHKLQLPGKKIISARDFLNSHADFISG
jgi:methionyl-tRNA formyltransferase